MTDIVDTINRYLVGDKEVSKSVRTRLVRARDEVPSQPKFTPFAWAISGVSQMFIGEYAEMDAHAEAKRCGGTCEAFALYRVEP